MSCLGGHFDVESSTKRLDELVHLSENPDLWDNQQAAQNILKEKRILEAKLQTYNGLYKSLNDNIDIAELADSEKDEQVLDEVQEELRKQSIIAQKFETECLFSGDTDANDCFIDINAGAGGTESHDWASMMMRMYLRFAERLGLKADLVNIISGEEAGIKSCTIKVMGHQAYGWLKTESGVHRLVRISPFNAAGKRMTSFASCWVYPIVDDNINIVIDEKDLKIDTFRSSGAGGQHVNTTDSAIRITHLPTNIVVQCQNDRSQHKNRAEAMKMLKSKLYELEFKKREDEASQQHSEKTAIGWGHQIRSYVLQPYQMVKDLRTDYETSGVQDVLDGNLEKFVYNSLAASVGNKRNK